MSPTDIHIIHAAAAHEVRLSRGGPDQAEDFAVTVTITPRVPVATAHAFSLHTVREISGAAPGQSLTRLVI
jgi:hypothetical protein